MKHETDDNRFGPNSVVALFHDSDQADAASSELRSQGFNRQHLGNANIPKHGDSLSESESGGPFPMAGAAGFNQGGFANTGFGFPNGSGALAFARFGGADLTREISTGKVPFVLDAEGRDAEAIAIIERNGGKVQRG